ncbi:hypothetical protein FO519_006397 [Halicephalobus sp. NKZ332]|nr:hypothetical protein FO519_006397 [Halicephalobus sp. NKZ332]
MRLPGKLFKKTDGKETEPVPGPSDLNKKDLLSKIKEGKKARVRKSPRNPTFCPLFTTTVGSSDDEETLEPSTVSRRNRFSSSFTEAVMASVTEVLAHPDLGTPGERASIAIHTVERALMPAHSTVEYKNVLVPDLVRITAASYYWGMMDRYEAETLLEGKPEGTFLLRDSAQINYLFSVSFRRYQRTLHARVEYLNGQFSFDIHDEKAFKSDSISKLVEHFKDPKVCWYYEPQLSIPLQRNFVFSLKHLCRSVTVTNTTYEGVSSLPLPPMLKKYLREYHYKQPIRITEHEF